MKGGRAIQDEALVERILKGDTEQFRQLVEKYQTYIYRLAYSVLRHEKDAEDAAQEAFVQIFVSLPHYRSKGFKTWISRIAVNKAVDVRRRKQHAVEQSAPLDEQGDAVLAHDGDDTASRMLAAEQREEIRHMLRGMPENYRNVLRAHYLEDKSVKEIAVEQGIAVKNVEMRLYRAKQWLRNNWNKGESS